MRERRTRCAVYTRKSTEEGLEQEFNTLHAQREACEAYVASQKAEGWTLVADHYDDGGYSGGTLERPALKRLLADIEAGRIDVVVVYKIDRLSRSLMDFSRLVEVFETHGITFVSITQAFNTTTSMGRLTLNMLLSFAQFEREVIGERIRDKFAASRRKGMWMGGWVPMGYRVENRRLVIDEEEARIIRMVFEGFARLKSGAKLASELADQGILYKTGRPFTKTSIYKLISNRVYIGDAVHKGTPYPGEHEAIIDQGTWDRVHAILAESPRTRSKRNRGRTPALLKGLIYGSSGHPMSPTHTRNRGRLYRYYVDAALVQGRDSRSAIARVPAGPVEEAVIGQVRALVQAPEVIVETWKALRATGEEITEGEVRETLHQFDALWAELFPAEQARIIQLLVDRVDLHEKGIDIRLRTDGLTSLMAELRTGHDNGLGDSVPAEQEKGAEAAENRVPAKPRRAA